MVVQAVGVLNIGLQAVRLRYEDQSVNNLPCNNRCLL